MDNRHLQAQPTLQTHHLRIHPHSHLYIHNHNHLPPHKCITHHQNPINHKTNNLHLLRPTLNPPTQPSIPDIETQCIPKSTNANQVKHSKPQPRQKDEHLCFYCNQPGHLKRNCPELPYCSKCRTRGHTPDKCTSKPQ